MKKISMLLIFVLLLGTFISPMVLADGDGENDAIDELHGKPILVLGEALSENQRDQVRDSLNATNTDQVEEYIVTGQDLQNFIGGNPNANMYSSAKVTHKNEGHGVVVEIVTPENITSVTREMYANALLTAGVENALVEVASPLKVTGHSALVGIYKAFNVEGESLDQDRMEVANQELNVVTEIVDEEGIDADEVTALLTEIKKVISELDPATREEIEQIVNEQLQNFNLELSPEHRELLIDLFDRMRSLNIDFGQVTQQLEDIVSDIRGRLDGITNVDTEGLWNGIKNFFQSIAKWFSGLFD
ncbi:DUF1002 domain-containing protein [Evansella sp. AB-P1]|uniref:DUF1002 domain-containing protein n=1 Tax=Evansella sp. AB-P1 TaxID=3037653 RepID=UPI0024203EE0|nr:DUF1002 domain-containing protein [Evansella sp. AB-P1]MDG5789086.1 DUF1002 domain-containing protein [Evansella sp. AB-P1]